MATLTRENSFSLTNPLEKEGDPKGTPSMQISSVGTSTTPASPKGHGVLMLELSHDHSHFLGLRTRPSGGPLTRSSSHTWRRMGTGATIPPPCTISGTQDRGQRFLRPKERARSKSTKVPEDPLLNSRARIDDLVVIVKKH